jgi:hypothetical protein
MPLVHRRVTPAKLAANRANARKSTGPRTHRGKCAVRLNALRHGIYASPKFFRTYIAGAREDVALYDWIYSQVSAVLRPRDRKRWAGAERVSRGTWCQFRMLRIVGIRRGWRILTSSTIWCRLRVPLCLAVGDIGTKPIYGVKSMDHSVTFRMRHEIQIGDKGIYLAFWTRRKPRQRHTLPKPAPPERPPGLGARMKGLAAGMWQRVARWCAGPQGYVTRSR